MSIVPKVNKVSGHFIQKRPFSYMRKLVQKSVWLISSVCVCKNSGTISFTKSLYEITFMFLYKKVSCVVCTTWSLYEMTVNRQQEWMPSWAHTLLQSVFVLFFTKSFESQPQLNLSISPSTKISWTCLAFFHKASWIIDELSLPFYTVEPKALHLTSVFK